MTRDSFCLAKQIFTTMDTIDSWIGHLYMLRNNTVNSSSLWQHYQEMIDWFTQKKKDLENEITLL